MRLSVRQIPVSTSVLSHSAHRTERLAWQGPHRDAASPPQAGAARTATTLRWSVRARGGRSHASCTTTPRGIPAGRRRSAPVLLVAAIEKREQCALHHSPPGSVAQRGLSWRRLGRRSTRRGRSGDIQLNLDLTRAGTNRIDTMELCRQEATVPLYPMATHGGRVPFIERICPAAGTILPPKTRRGS